MIQNRTLTQDDPDEEEPDVTSINIQAGTALSDLLRPSFGPTGRDKMIVDPNQMVIITNDGATILGEIDVAVDIVPSARLITELAESQSDRFGDGTKTATILAGELLRRAEKLLDRGLHPTVIADGYSLAAERTVDVVENRSFEVTVADTDDLTRVAKMTMTGRGATGVGDALADFVVEAAQAVEEEGTVDLDHVTTVKVRGGTLRDSELFQGVVIDTTDPVLTSMPTSVPDARIVCVDAPMSPTESRQGDAEIDFRDPDEMQTFIDYERDAATRLVDTLVDHGVNIVFCTNDIGQKTRLELSKNGILATKRTLASDVKQIARATGASAVADIGELETADVGRADIVELRQFGREQLFAIEGCEGPKSVSLLLRGGVEHSLDEVERSVRNGLSTVSATVDGGRLVPGGGALETEIAGELRKYADSLPGREQLVIRAYADVLEVVPRTLAQNMGHDPIDSLVELRQRHSRGKRNAGIAPEGGIIDDVRSADIVEPYNVKHQAITGASEVVTRVLKVDDVLLAEELDDEPY